MLLENSLYSIKKIKNIDDLHSVFVIEINYKNKILEGHFPNKPVLPGVCIVEIIRELASKIIGHDVNISSIKNIKFLKLINPNNNISISFDIEISNIDDFNFATKAICNDNNSTFAKINMTITTNRI